MGTRLVSARSFAFAPALASALAASVGAAPGVARAEEAKPEATNVDLSKDLAATPADAPAPPADAPPPPPYKKSVVLDSSIGVLAFLGEFGKVAPPAPWLHTQLGYEVIDWLMLFAEGELAFTDTSSREAPPRTRAFAIFGFGGGARFTARLGGRVGLFAQLGVGMMKADIAQNALGNLGFKDAETLDAYGGARVGVEWYQVDRHFALGLAVGVRSAQGFAFTRPRADDSPVAADAALSLRYAF